MKTKSISQSSLPASLSLCNNIFYGTYNNECGVSQSHKYNQHFYSSCWIVICCCGTALIALAECYYVVFATSSSCCRRRRCYCLFHIVHGAISILGIIHKIQSYTWLNTWGGVFVNEYNFITFSLPLIRKAKISNHTYMQASAHNHKHVISILLDLFHHFSVYEVWTCVCVCVGRWMGINGWASAKISAGNISKMVWNRNSERFTQIIYVSIRVLETDMKANGGMNCVSQILRKKLYFDFASNRTE